MFDIGFSELFVIGVVALIVIGPERLPGVARTLGHLFGRMQRYVNEVKSDIQREVELDELRKLRESVEASAREIEQSVSREVNRAGDEMREIEALLDPRPGVAATPDEPGAKVAETGAADMKARSPAESAEAKPAGSEPAQPHDGPVGARSEPPATAPQLAETRPETVEMRAEADEAHADAHEARGAPLPASTREGA